MRDDYMESYDVARGLNFVLGESVLDLPPDLLERRIMSAVSGLSPSEAESFASALGDVGRFVTSKEVRGIAGAALPIAGTAVGTMFGGPVGAAVGASVGGMAGQAIAGAPPAPRASPAPAQYPPSPQNTTATPAQYTLPPQYPMPATPAPAPALGGSPAAAQLLGVLQNPALLSSLASLVMGASGKSSVPVGGAEVPVGAMMNLVSVLANRAAEDAEEILAARQDGLPSYLYDEAGCLSCDPAVPAQRADALMRVLRSDRASRVASAEPGPCGCSECAEDLNDDNWW